MCLAAPEIVAPAFFTHPEFASTAGDEVADLAASLILPDGNYFTPDPEQRMLLRATYAETSPGASFTTRTPKWSAFEVAYVVARQNFKTATLEMSVVGDLWLLGARLVIWTAHLFNPAAAESFLHIKQLIEGNAFLSKRVKRINEASDNKGVELMNGARIKFLARSHNAGRSLSGDVLVVDEAYRLLSPEMGAVLPTLNARPNAQVRYGSSAAHHDSEYLLDLVERGRKGQPSLMYAEYCSTKPCASATCPHIPGTPGCVGDDEGERRKANPSLGRRIEPETLQKLRLALSGSPREFMREAMGHHDSPANAPRVIPDAMFARLVRDSAISGAVTVVPEVSMDRSSACVWVCGAGPDGVPQVEPAERGAGTEWVADRVAEILGRNEVLAVGVRSGGPAASLIGDVERVCAERGVEFVKVHSGPMAGFCGQFFDAVMGDVPGLHHRGDAGLFDQVKAAKRKRSVDAWSWERSDVDVDMADLVASTAAFGLFVERAADGAVTYDLAASFR